MIQHSLNELKSEWNITIGKILLENVAIATIENRVVAKGLVDLSKDSLSIYITVVDINSYSIISQTIDGSLEEPNQSDMKIAGTVLAPISNFVGGALGKDCNKIYQGKLEHPLNKKKRKNK